MISFKEFVEQEDLNEGFKRKLTGAVAAGLMAGAVGGAHLADMHRDQNAQTVSTVAKGKKMVDAQRWAKERKIERATKAALSDPHAERRSSELSDKEMGNFHTSYGWNDDHAQAARGKLTMPQNDKRMSQARSREIHPDAEDAFNLKTAKNHYAAGKFTLNNNRPPTPEVNSWFGSGNMKVEAPKKGKK